MSSNKISDNVHKAIKARTEINHKVFYKLYAGEKEQDLEYLIKQVAKYRKILKEAFKELRPYRKHLCAATDYIYSNKSKKSIYFVDDLEDLEIDKSKIPHNTEYITTLIKDVVIARSMYVKYCQKRDKLKENLILFKDYSLILKKINDKIGNLLLEGFEWKLGYGKVSLQVVTKIGKKPRIDYNATMKKKAEILERGGILYSKMGELQAQLKGIPYEGEHYIIYHPLAYPLVYLQKDTNALDTYKHGFNFKVARKGSHNTRYKSLSDKVHKKFRELDDPTEVFPLKK